METSAPQTASKIAAVIEVAAIWRQPYPDLEVFRLYLGPFYAGEISRTISEGWKASMPSGVIMQGYDEAAARDLVERDLRRVCADAQR